MFCQSKTIKGLRCSRKASNGDYCTQHLKINMGSVKIVGYVMPNIPDDIMLNHILYSMDLVTLTEFSQVSQQSQRLCGDQNFWYRRFKELLFFCDIPTRTANVIKEYRRIHEANVISHSFFYSNHDISCSISGRANYMKKWVSLNTPKLCPQINIQGTDRGCHGYVFINLQLETHILDFLLESLIMANT